MDCKRERARLVREEPAIGNRRIIVVRVIALPGIRPDIRRAESGVPAGVFHRQVVLHAVRDLQIRVYGGGERHRGRPGSARGRKNLRQNDYGLPAGLLKGASFSRNGTPAMVNMRGTASK